MSWLIYQYRLWTRQSNNLQNCYSVGWRPLKRIPMVSDNTNPQRIRPSLIPQPIAAETEIAVREIVDAVKARRATNVLTAHTFGEGVQRQEHQSWSNCLRIHLLRLEQRSHKRQHCRAWVQDDKAKSWRQGPFSRPQVSVIYIYIIEAWTFHLHNNGGIWCGEWNGGHCFGGAWWL